MMLQTTTTWKVVILSWMMFFCMVVNAKKVRGQGKHGGKNPPLVINEEEGLCGRRHRHLMGSKEGKLVTIIDNNDEQEQEEADDTSVTNFISEFYLAYGGPTGIFVGTDVTTVENTIQMTYNEVIGCSQDLVLDLVTIAEQLYYPPEEQEDAGQGRRSLAKSYTLVNRYSVSGRCRFCSTGTTKLFNDALRRKLQQETTTEEFNAAALINLNAAGIVSVTSVSATNERPLDGDETQLLGDIDALVEGIVESQPSAFGGSV